MKKRILIYEDDEELSKVLKIILHEQGIEHMVLKPGRKILSQIEKFKPGLILIDILMPQTDGRKITKTIKANPKTKSIPVILFSAINNLEKTSKEINADGYLSKPFKIKNFISTIKKFI